MNSALIVILPPFMTAFIAAVLLVPLSLIFIKKYKLIDDPTKRKHPAILHKKPVPRGGGIPLFLSCLLAGLIFLPLTKITIAIFTASFISLIVGVLDDKFDLSPYLRFSVNILSSAIVIFAGVNIAFITNPFGGILHLNKINISFLGINASYFFIYLIAILWIVWVMNMLNWSKGVDGQMPGIVAISAIVIGVLGLRFNATDHNTIISITLSFIIAGSALGFLIYNFYPARIFPGYGATSLYLLLAVASILSSAKLATAILVMGIPMVDGLFTIIRRLISGKSPFWHDNKHLHHLLLKRHWGQRRIALFYWFISAMLGAISLSLSSKGKLFAIIMLAIIVGGGILFLQVTIKHKENENGN
jgi:UDP-GlcNAc:undecaprenyl-phosphate/decaprenyl-phosphate GlcNAc-1-phosphate transferase